MTYCSRCGKKNEDSAKYCNDCGSPLRGTRRDYERHREDHCEEDCAGGKRGASVFWAIIIILIGLFIIWEFGIKNMPGAPGWMEDVEFAWIIPVVIAIAIIITGIKMITSDRDRRDRNL